MFNFHVPLSSDRDGVANNLGSQNYMSLFKFAQIAGGFPEPRSSVKSVSLVGVKNVKKVIVLATL